MENTDGLIYVVDSADRRRMEEAADELTSLLEEGDLSDVPLLVLANKQDLINSLSVEEVSDSLGFHLIRDRNSCKVLESSRNFQYKPNKQLVQVFSR